ncbi:signal transduction histidine kinase [Streptomyces sp. SAI-135]|uniref:sensor histidine kinase n=1 Tax=unclassified Streptomyces TaxID=2593676 RepID=UPI0024769A86|nr:MULTISPECIES: histidine kinase [unclassified Streptomyces]MDH6513728.1 signal transduction histidine kinase [Streptomyces sp. SAI-090]MDH6622192.1 signal transduction histidine kinase [Streptomyces sp. SAI-135]
MTTRAVVRVMVLASVVPCGFALWVSALPRSQPTGAMSGASFVIALSVVNVGEACIAAVLIHARPRNAIGWIFAGLAVTSGWEQAFVAYGGYGLAEADPVWPGARLATVVASGLFVPGWVASATLLVALYPDGRLAARWWRWPVGAVVAGTVVLTFLSLFDSHAYGDLFPGLPAPLSMPPTLFTWLALGVCLPLLALSALVIWGGTVLRLLRSRPPERQLLVWLMCTEVPCMGASFYSAMVDNRPLPSVLLSFLVVVAVAVGVLRYRLLGIEAVLRRGLVYGLLTGAVIAVYLALTVGIGSALNRHPLLGVVAAALVAVLLAPARDRLQRAVDWLVYGERRDPLRALARLGDQVAVAGEPDLLPAALSAVMRAVRAPGAEVRAPDGHTVGQQGVMAAAGPSLPLRVGGRDLGTLTVAARRPAASYDTADLQLLAALALQVATLLRALELTEALEAERDHVVAATHAERDRIRHDLHDGLGPSLSGMGLGLQALADALDCDGATPAGRLLARIRQEVTTAVGEIRRIIDGLRPTVLDTLGLAEAIRQYAKTLADAVPVEVKIDGLPFLSPGLEATAYRIVTESLTNTARHAGACRACVRISAADGSLQVTVTDTGRGIPDRAAPGLGLMSMRRRAQVLGGTLHVASRPGCTTVAAALPLGVV